MKGRAYQSWPEEPLLGSAAHASGVRRATIPHVSKVDWQSEKLTSEQGRFLNRVFTEFAAGLAPTLTPLFSLRVMVDLDEVGQKPFQEFLDDFSSPTPVAIFSLDEKSKGLLTVETPISFAAFDFLLGGKGEVIEDSREFTEIEKALFRNQILTRFMSAYSEAWKEIAPLSSRIETLEFSPTSIMLYPYEEILLTARFTLRIGVMTGRFEIALPLRYVRAVLPRTPVPFGKEAEARKKGDAAAQASPFVGRKIESTPMTVSVELGKSEVYFQDLLNLEEGDIVRLSARRGEPLRIRVAGRTKFLGKPATSEKKMVIRITDIIQEGDETFDD